MRGADGQTAALFSYVSCEARVPADHPLRLIRAVVDEALEALSGEFEGLYARVGRPSIAPEKLLRALLLQAFYSVRSERALMEQLDYNLLFRWFVGLSMDAPVWDASTFSKNRARLLAGDVAQRFLAAVVAQPRVAALMSSEHFSVDGTLIGAWASQKSFRPKAESDDGGDGTPPPSPAAGGGGSGRNADADWRGQKRSNETHASTTDPDARLARKADGQSSLMAYAGHVLMENRSGLVRLALATRASGTAEREAALAMLDRLRATTRRRLTLGADRGYDVGAFIADLRQRRVTPHIARDDHLTKTGKRRRSSIDARTTRHPGYGVSQRVRKRIEEVFGWLKTTATLRQTRHRGLPRVAWTFTLATAAYNLVRLPGLLRGGT
ncbi:IS5 family transposase (plasmid) [Roseomonas sp. CCTCC AB2023176]|uniref:IS5 family transposase n=1 Tax=Roseomonas sp. CCTCC AB2023176 TaxID=3342640 RepID=UPI0035E3B8BA